MVFTKIFEFVGGFKNIITLVMAGVVIFLLVIVYWHYDNYKYLQKTNKTLEKNLKEKEEQRKTAIQIANINAHVIRDLKEEHKKNLELLQKSYTYNTKLRKKRDELKKSILAYKDNKLSIDDMDFIKKLYPEANR